MPDVLAIGSVLPLADAERSDGNVPDSRRPEAGKPDSTHPAARQPDRTRPDTRQPDAGQLEPTAHVPEPAGAHCAADHPAEHPRPGGTESLPDAFWAVARRLREQFRDTTAPWDVTPAQARALVVLLRRGTIRLSDLSADLRIAPRSTTEVVDALAERGLVARGPDPTDRRAVLITVTPAGQAAGVDIRRARSDQSDRFFAALPEGDRAELHRLLRALLP